MDPPPQPPPLQRRASVRFKPCRQYFTHKNKTYRRTKIENFPKDFIQYSTTYTADVGVMWLNPPPHLLRCVVIGKKSRIIVVEDFDCYLEDKIAELDEAGIVPCMRAQIPVVRGSNLRKKLVTYIPDIFKEYLRSMVRFLVALHKDGYCTRGFGMEDIVLKGDKIHFFDPELFQPKSYEKNPAELSDFECLHKVVRQIYARYQVQNLPHDFNVWCDHLLTAARSVVGMLVDHVGTLSHSERLLLLREIHEKREDFTYKNHHPHNDVLWQIRTSPRQHPQPAKRGIWFNRFGEQDGAMRPCFDFEQNSYMNTNSEQYQLFRFCRNLAAHARDYKQQLEPSKINNMILDVSIFDMFGHEICLFQEYAHTTILQDGRSLLSHYSYTNKSQ